ncbi:anti-phage ZorAB system protein ZorA [Vogesella indigofera]|uniref:anti-phage ZorAB system protein ZorA n=1 Tax=Vogesella indigofera TaxID=45465 RepID=UPI00234ECEED|nr:anti-phage ZorAB system protein ZorA [Vogesella indigofera]MDC7698328.1 anti-phage ZorAB system protein ZorA [Vogesella indigofera]
MSILFTLGSFEITTGIAHAIPQVIVTCFIVYFFRKFWLIYRWPALNLKAELVSLREKIDHLFKAPHHERKIGLDSIFDQTALAHQWEEYKETLHDQFDDHEGEFVLKLSRSTQPASFYFSSSSVVDRELQTEYFKHLPGILTGLGIIGTFAGLLLGLSTFDPSNPEKIQESVSSLLDGVLWAFIASALAIVAAMWVTNSEKKLLRENYAAIDDLADALDRLFHAGVGEEYLLSLVNSSKESANQARMLKDSLVTDLREMLQNIVDSQVRENLRLAETLGSAYRESGQTMAASISQSIEQSFKEPLTKIADSVQAASGDQSERVQSLLQDVLVTFMHKLESTFGQQFTGMQEMMQQSMQSMQQMQKSFHGLIEQMQSASTEGSRQVREELARALTDMQSNQAAMQSSMSEMLAGLQQAVGGISRESANAGAEMAEQMRQLFADNEARQQQMAAQFQVFVDGLKSSIGTAQHETMAKMNSSVSKLAEQLGGVMQSLEDSRHGMNQAAQVAQERLQAESQAMVEGMGQRIESLLAAMDAQRSQSDSTIEQLTKATASSLESMKSGADKMRVAADSFSAAASAGHRMSESSSSAADKMQQGAQSVSLAAKTLAEQIAEYRSQREAVQKMLASLDSVIAQSNADKQSRSQMQTELNAIFQSMQRINTESANFLDKAEAVLSKSFSTFGDGVVRGLNQSLGSMDAELSKAVKALAGGVEELNDSIDSMADILGKRPAKA